MTKQELLEKIKTARIETRSQLIELIEQLDELVECEFVDRVDDAWITAWTCANCKRRICWNGLPKFCHNCGAKVKRGTND